MSKKFFLKYCKQKTSFTKSFYMVLDEDNNPIGMPISKRSQAIAIIEFLNSVCCDTYWDSKTNSFKQDIY